MNSRLRLIFLTVLIALVSFSFSFDLARRHRGGFKSDEASYFAIIQSLAYDYDIVYEKKDLNRILQRFWVGPTGLFLKKTSSGRLVYAKSFIYPLFAAPFFRLFDVQGIILFNALLLFAILLMGYILLKDYTSGQQALLFSFFFIVGSVLCCYIWWMTADLFNCCLVFAALFFFFKKFPRPGLFYLSPIFAAIAILSKPSNLVLFSPIFLLLLIRREYKKVVISALLMFFILTLFVIYNEKQSGDWNFMAGERRSFYGNYPYETAQSDFNSAIKMSADDYWQRYFISPQIALLNIFYFLFGRFTGIFFYFFPAILFLILFLFSPRQSEDYFILAAAIFAILTFILLAPLDYFGGGGSLGNRYFLNIYPLFFFLGHKNRKSLPLLPALLATAIFIFPITADSMENSGYPGTPSKHFPYKFLPPEKTQYKSLPTNLNPRAFNREIVNGATKSWLFFLNDNFYDLEENEFWTFGNRSCEFFLITPFKPEKILFEISNHPAANRVVIKVEDKDFKLRLPAQSKIPLTINAPQALRVDRGYLLQITVRSLNSYFPYGREGNSADRRVLGVRLRIVPEANQKKM